MTERTFVLRSVRDIRPIDFLTGKRVPLNPGDGATCDRCGKEHAIVWEIEETTPGRARLWSVGSRCGPRILDGWSPEGDELRKARKADRDGARDRAARAAAADLLDLLRRLDVPLPGTVREPNEWSDRCDWLEPKDLICVDDDVTDCTGHRVSIQVDRGAEPTARELEWLRRRWIVRRVRLETDFATSQVAESYLANPDEEALVEDLKNSKGWR